MVMVRRMTKPAMLRDLSDKALLSSLARTCGEGHAALARVVVHLMEVEERNLHLKASYTSMFDFCIRHLNMSEGAAFRRINAARLAQRFPRLLASIERGDVNLDALVLVRDHLTEANIDALVAEVARKTKREVQEIVARLAPRPDAPEILTRMPGGANVTSGSAAPDAGAGARAGAASTSHPRGQIEPLGDARYKMQITASAELCAKVERARALMRHRNPSGDLSVLVERAFDALLEKLEKERLGKSGRPQRNMRAPERTHDRATGHATARMAIPRAVRREVFERDGECCTFENEEGTRCTSRDFLELDHIQLHAQGGEDTASNLRVRCRPHNRLHAEQTLGKEAVARAMDFRQQKSMQRSATPRDVTEAGVVSPTRVAVASEGTAPANGGDTEATITRPSGDPEQCPTLRAAMCGLKSLGFRERDARHALAVVAARLPERRMTSTPIERVIREALALLT